MNEQTDNLFYHPRPGGGAEYEQNVTKHLLTVLNRLGDDATLQIWEAIAEDVPDQDSANFEYEIEVTPQNCDLGETRHLVGLSRWGQSFEGTQPSTKDARADGCITLQHPDSGEPIASVVLEVKTGDATLSQEQLSRYQDQFDIPPENCSTSQWTSVYQALNLVSPNNRLEQTLQQEFLDYLCQEQLQGTAAKITDQRKDEEQSHLHKEIRIRRQPEQTDATFEIRFWGTYYDPDTETPSETTTYTTRWMGEETFMDLLNEIDEDVRKSVFVDLIESGEAGDYPAYKQLQEWAEDGGFGGDSRTYQGSSSEVFAETIDEDGGYPEIRFANGGGNLRFGRITSKGGSNRTPLDLVPWEFEDLIADIDNPDVRSEVFVKGNLEPLWNYYIDRQ